MAAPTRGVAATRARWPCFELTPIMAVPRNVKFFSAPPGESIPAEIQAAFRLGGRGCATA
jgi:hypothetical protein